MKDLCSPEIALFRNLEADLLYDMRDEDRSYGGAFEIPFRASQRSDIVWLRVIASREDGEGSGMDWDHVSVSTETRCPTWEEMCFVKELFFEPNEAAMQLHPVREDYINNHPFCLHLWRPIAAAIPLPPSILVGLPELNVA